jgi:hypothetical protein
MIFPHIKVLSKFFLANIAQVDKYLNLLESGELTCAQKNKFEMTLPEEVMLTEDVVETLKALAKGLTVQDLMLHNEDEEALPKTEQQSPLVGVAYWIEKFLGVGTIDAVKTMIADAGSNPEKALELMDWAVESWPTWKARIEPLIQKYKPTVVEATQVLAGALAPIIDMPAVLLFGISLRDEIVEQRAFRNNVGKMAQSITDYFDIKTPNEMELG